jgi:hypothetical protein
VIIPLLFAFGLICATVLIHALGTWEAVVYLARGWFKRKPSSRRLGREIQIIRVVSVLLLIHLMEAAIWAAFYRISGLFFEFETALYFSITSYTTVGYGDVLLPPSWRVLGPMEAAVGILMFGWSTAIIVAAITRMQADQLTPEPSAG